ncbi:MAG TPA: tetratricopeptide repeat protein [Acidobacteriota bacterium]|nr:tetratricopeptide repeat protein [Acidobacteriota bacterium]
MSKCSDSRISRMLLAYELNMLGEAERREVEIHILDCAHCYERVRDFQAMGRLIRDDPEARECIRSIITEEQAAERTDSARRLSPKLRRRASVALRFAALVSAIVLLLVLKPWRIEFQPSDRAVAAENRLAVMYFENLADSSGIAALGEIVTNLFITDLSQSQYLQVVSSQRLHDILKLLGQDGAKTLDKNTAAEVARRARATWMITGSILKMQPRPVITIQLVEVSSGLTLASHRITGEPDESIFGLVDKLTVEVRRMLPPPTTADWGPDRLVAEVTTDSREAYYNYLKGVEYYNKLYYGEAEVYFRHALDLDSTFAMAYYYLAQLADTGLIARAVEFSDGSSPIEGHHIRSLSAALSGDYEKAIEELRVAVQRYPDDKEAFYRMGRYRFARGQYDVAIRLLDSAVQIDPSYGIALNQLAYAYDAIGDGDRAIQAIDEYVKVAPDEANPYDSRGEICARHGRLDEAIESYRRAVAIKPDFITSWMNLGFMYIYKGEYTLADSCLRALVAEGNQIQRSAARLYLSYIPLYQGKFEEALDVLNDGLSADRIDRVTSQLRHKHAVRSSVFREQGKLEQAIQEIELAMEAHHRIYPEDREQYRCRYAQLLAEKGEVELAEQVVRELKEFLEENERPMTSYHLARGLFELAVSNPDLAEVHFEKAVEASGDFFGRFMLAKTRLELGKLDRSIAAFEDLSKVYSSLGLFSGNLSVKVYYYLGLAYEQKGDVDMAIARYETFLDIWTNADPGIGSVQDATERLARLRSKS